MTRTRNMADLLDSSGDIKSSALDNVPPSNDASALTTGTLAAARLPATIDGRDLSVDGAKLDGIEASATADQTDAEIKTAYENNSDTNAFTDALQTKLNGIEASADVTDTTNVTSAGALMKTGGTMSGNLGVTANNPNIRFDDSDTSNNGEITLDNTSLRIEVDEDNAVANSLLAFRIDGSEKARIVSGGSVGVGLATPTMNGNGIATHIHSNTSSTAAALRLTTADSGSAATDGLLVAHWSDGNAYVYNYENSNLIFGTNSQNRVIVTPTGLDVTGTMYASGNIGRDVNDYIAWANNSHLDFVVNGGIEMRLESDGDLHVDGNITAFSTTVSDPRLKTDIEPVIDALAKVEQLNGYTFTYKHDGSHSAGVVSTEVADVLPSAVRKSKVPLVAGHDNETEYDIVQYDQLHALLIEAVKELSARVKELENDAAK